MARAGARHDASVGDRRLEAVPVELDLVDEFRVRRGRVHEGGEAGLDEAGEGRALRLASPGGLARPRGFLRGFGRRIGFAALRPDRIAAFRDLLDESPGLHAARCLFQNVDRVRRPREPVLGLDEEPIALLFAASRPQPHEVPAPLQLLSREREFEVSLVETPMRVAFRRPGPAVPQQHGAAARRGQGTALRGIVGADRRRAAAPARRALRREPDDAELPLIRDGGRSRSRESADAPRHSGRPRVTSEGSPAKARGAFSFGSDRKRAGARNRVERETFSGQSEEAFRSRSLDRLRAARSGRSGDRPSRARSRTELGEVLRAGTRSRIC